MSANQIPPWRRSDISNDNSRPTNPRKRPAPSDAQEDAWVAEEDQFVLRQAKRKAALRVKSQLSKPIDRLAVTLAVIDPTRNQQDDEDEDGDVEVVDPEGYLESLDQPDLEELRKDIDTYLHLESHPANKEFWQTMKMICKERLERLSGSGSSGRGMQGVTADVEKLLGPKTYDELEGLEKQVRRKLNSNEAIDVDYWEQLLRSIQTCKAKARLRTVSQSILKSRMETLRKQQAEHATIVTKKLQPMVQGLAGDLTLDSDDATLDPEPLLKLSTEDKGLPIMDERSFLSKVTQARRRVQKTGYVPIQQKIRERPTPSDSAPACQETLGQGPPTAFGGGELSEVANAQYHREVARGFWDNEEVFAAEEAVTNNSAMRQSGSSTLRKPQSFNRVQLGYEWNKYNQTHYDQDNPPPKVVQGYRFNIFYPNLIDKTKAPTYKIEREGGRKRGQTFAPAGEDDICVIRFIAGPPYQDIAFRIVDREWDYSAKRDRGFKSTFENGVLSLYFQFKKVYYRK